MSGQWKLVPVEPTETMVINGFESVPNECFTDDEVWEQYQEMSGCQQAAFRAKLCWAAMVGSAPAAPEADAKSVCDHEWTDDGEFLLVCTKCGTQENHDPKWRDIESAPKDGTLVRLLVSFDEHSTEDADEAPTIGANNFDNDGEDVWRFAGWCWTHDHFTQGVGTPVGWLPMIEASASTDKLDWVTAERDALQQRLNAADQLNDDRAGTCEWSREEDSGIWNSGCGETWSFHEDGPEENGMHYCHSCGKHLVVEVAEQEQDEDWRMHPCKQGHRDVGAAGGVAACNQCDEKIEAATTQEAFERWNATHPQQ